MQTVALLTVAGACALADILSRRVPAWLCFSLLAGILALWLVGLLVLTPLGALVGAVGTVGARMPGGDARAAVLAGILGGPPLTALALLLAHATAAMRWQRGERGFPWVPHFAVPLAFLAVVTHGG